MNEKTLTKISVVGSVLSIILLYFMTLNIIPEGMAIGNLDRSLIGRSVSITGKITSLYVNNGNMFMNVADESGEIKAVLWKDTLEMIRINDINPDTFEVGKKIDITGEIQEYKGELEIVPVKGVVKLAD
ncbi:MAG: OB-fold nucleic acid binding domain-containing protein [Candidatus Aenigmatarchaeota archaeon]